MRILSFFLIVLSSVSFGFLYSGLAAAGCDATAPGDAGAFLRGCANLTGPTNGIDPNKLGGGVIAVKDLVIQIAKRVIQFGALFAIGAIVLSGVQYTTSYGDDEKVKKAKTTGIYAVIGLLLLLVAFPLVDIIVNFVYGLGT